MQFPSYRVFPSDFKTFFPHLAEEEMERALVVCVLAEGKKLNHVLWKGIHILAFCMCQKFEDKIHEITIIKDQKFIDGSQGVVPG